MNKGKFLLIMSILDNSDFSCHFFKNDTSVTVADCVF